MKKYLLFLLLCITGCSSVEKTGVTPRTDRTIWGVPIVQPTSGNDDQVMTYNLAGKKIDWTGKGSNPGGDITIEDVDMEITAKTPDVPAVKANTAKVGITTAQAQAIENNSAKVGITPTQANNINTNNAKPTLAAVNTAISNGTAAKAKQLDVTGNNGQVLGWEGGVQKAINPPEGPKGPKGDPGTKGEPGQSVKVRGEWISGSNYETSDLVAEAMTDGINFYSPKELITNSTVKPSQDMLHWNYVGHVDGSGTILETYKFYLSQDDAHVITDSRFDELMFSASLVWQKGGEGDVYTIPPQDKIWTAWSLDTLTVYRKDTEGIAEAPVILLVHFSTAPLPEIFRNSNSGTFQVQFVYEQSEATYNLFVKNTTDDEVVWKSMWDEGIGKQIINSTSIVIKKDCKYEAWIYDFPGQKTVKKIEIEPVNNQVYRIDITTK